MDKHYGSLRTIKEEVWIYLYIKPKEQVLEKKVREGAEKLKSTLSQIKNDMDKLSIKTNFKISKN